MKKHIKLTFLMIIVLISASVITYHIIWTIRLRNIPASIKSQTEAVLKAYQWSKLTGSYWENKLQDQVEKIRVLPLDVRLIFYQEILLACDLDTSRGTIFIEAVGNDAEPFHANLSKYVNDPKFLSLRKEEQNKILGWRDVMEIIVQQQTHMKLPRK